MRNVIISIIAFFVMITLMIFSINYLNKISLNLQKLNDTLEQYIADDKWDEAYKLSIDLTHKWEVHSKIIKVFVNHQEIDNVEMELWKLPQYVKQETKDEALASVHTLKFLIRHISNLEKVNLQNTF
jgi:hypothetical protein